MLMIILKDALLFRNVLSYLCWNTYEKLNFQFLIWNQLSTNIAYLIIYVLHVLNHLLMAILKADQFLLCKMLSLYDLSFLDYMTRFSKNSFLSKAQDLEDAQRYLLILDKGKEVLKHLEFFMRKILMNWGSQNLSCKIFRHLCYH